MKNLDGKVAIVTGATRGVGRGIALELAEAGAVVCATGRSIVETELATTERLIPVPCDHSRDSDLHPTANSVSFVRKILAVSALNARRVMPGVRRP